MTNIQKQNKKLRYHILSKIVLLIITICALILPFTIGSWIQSGYHNIHLIHFVFMIVAIAIYLRPSKQKTIIDTMLVFMFLTFLILIGAYEYGLSIGLLTLLVATTFIIAILHNAKISIIYSIVMVTFCTATILFFSSTMTYPIGIDVATLIFTNSTIYSVVTVLISLALMALILINFRNTLKKSFIEIDEQGKKIDYLANHDQLTGLSSPRLAREQFELTLNMAKRHQFKAAILYIDIDDFRLINEALGLDAGDYALKEVAKRIKELIRDTDIACRQGGDEFLVVLHYPVSKQACDIICKRLITAFDARVPYRDQEIKINLSIGVSIYPDHGNTQFELRAKAAQAMQVSKAKDKHYFTFAD